MSRTDEALAEERERRGRRRMTSGRRIWRPRRRRLFRRLAGGVEAHTQFTSCTRTERLELEQSICSFSTILLDAITAGNYANRLCLGLHPEAILSLERLHLETVAFEYQGFAQLDIFRLVKIFPWAILRWNRPPGRAIQYMTIFDKGKKVIF
jgi:hypothetical protein